MRKAKIKRNFACRPNTAFSAWWEVTRSGVVWGEESSKSEIHTTEQGKVGNNSTCCTHLTDVVKRSCVHCYGCLLPKPACTGAKGLASGAGWPGDCCRDLVLVIKIKLTAS